jgi:hypothetical protein
VAVLAADVMAEVEVPVAYYKVQHHPWSLDHCLL